MQLNWVQYFASLVYGPEALKNIKSVKFKSELSPPGTVSLSISESGDSATKKFEISLDDALKSTGCLLVEESDLGGVG